MYKLSQIQFRTSLNSNVASRISFYTLRKYYTLDVFVLNRPLSNVISHLLAFKVMVDYNCG